MTYCNNGTNGIYSSDSYKIYGKYLKDADLKKAKEMWFKYILLDMLIHEMTHALQDNENVYPLDSHVYLKMAKS
ncbi:hypothetical protein [Clostridium septicum]|uniref:hypothetical protein n=1 Tax=Clostridium septicum TaxID=1504 RepID=UPI000FF8E601|nr:hypothetical protein [Clostridium septicum]QAS59618.1 hypothetical protein EI377_01710 [Clostridium septicum]